MFHAEKEQILENLQILQNLLDDCVEEGLFDAQAHDHNELFDLFEETKVASSLEELSEVIERAKILEIELDAWFSKLGKTTISLLWPKL